MGGSTAVSSSAAETVAHAVATGLMCLLLVLSTTIQPRTVAISIGLVDFDTLDFGRAVKKLNGPISMMADGARNLVAASTGDAAAFGPRWLGCCMLHSAWRG